jgi:hypothetical protein
VRALVLIIIILFGAVKLNTKYIYLISHVSADYWVVDIPGTHKQRYRSTDSDKIVDNIVQVIYYPYWEGVAIFFGQGFQITWFIVSGPDALFWFTVSVSE